MIVLVLILLVNLITILVWKIVKKVVVIDTICLFKVLFTSWLY